ETYARLILKDLSLPLPGAGWETHQPPLYYALSALALGITGLDEGDKGYLVLRGINGILGLIHCWVAFLCLRLLFPTNFQAQAVGLLVAAFLPFHLYQSQYVTNDPLAGFLVTAACFFCLRSLRAEKLNICWYAGVGLALGAAVLTKLTAALA